MHGSKPHHTRIASLIGELTLPDSEDEEEESAPDHKEANLGMAGEKVQTGSSDVVVGLTTLPVRVSDAEGQKSEVVNCLLDSGTNVTLITSRLAVRLALEGRVAPFLILSMGGNYNRHMSMVTHVRVAARDGKNERKVPVRVLQSLTGEMKTIDWSKHQPEWPHLSGIDFKKAQTAWEGVDLILGNDQAYLMRTLEEKSGPPEGPVARRTPLGGPVRGRFVPIPEATWRRCSLDTPLSHHTIPSCTSPMRS